MTDAWLAFVSATAGELVGGTASIVATYVTSNAQSAAAREDWKRRRQDARDGAQRELVFEMQDTMAACARATAQIMIEDTKNAKAGGEYGLELVGDELSEAARQLGARFRILVSRLADGELRNLASAFADKTHDVTLAQSRAQAESHFAQMAALAEAVNLRVTVVLQDL